VLIFLSSTNPVIRTHCSGAGTQRTKFGTLEGRGGAIRMVGKRADLVLGNGVTGVGYGDGAGIFHIAELQNMRTALLDIYQSRCQLTVIPAVGR
jgi:hypothetical protein